MWLKKFDFFLVQSPDGVGTKAPFFFTRVGSGNEQFNPGDVYPGKSYYGLSKDRLVIKNHTTLCYPFELELAHLVGVGHDGLELPPRAHLLAEEGDLLELVIAQLVAAGHEDEPRRGKEPLNSRGGGADGEKHRHQLAEARPGLVGWPCPELIKLAHREELCALLALRGVTLGIIVVEVGEQLGFQGDQVHGPPRGLQHISVPIN
jgi:hypothetical protein